VAHDNLPDDGLPPCATCKNLRWVRIQMCPDAAGKPSCLVRCPDCGQLARRQHRLLVYRNRRDRIEKYTQKVGRYARQTFASFAQRQGEGAVAIRKAHQAALAFAKDPHGWLVMYGPKGTGKSHLAAAIANHLETLPEDERPLVMFLTAPDLLDLLRSGYRAGDYDELLSLCREAEVLILDDLGAEQETDWAMEKIFQIINHRYQMELPTVVVTNNRLEELDPRIYDRLGDDDLCVKVRIIAPTYRQRLSAPGTVVQ
jgi:DNA replication protein DnaC